MSLHAKDIMSSNVLKADVSTTVLQASTMMTQQGVSCLIVTQGDLPIGIVTETDFTRKVVAQQLDLHTPIQHIMNSPLIHSNPSGPIFEIANVMTQNHIKKIPVLDGSHVEGIITQTDIIKHIFHMIHVLQHSYEQGELSSSAFAEQSTKLFSNVNPSLEHTSREWHMVCGACHHQFMNLEEDGVLQIQQCPKCGSTELRYDQSPH